MTLVNFAWFILGMWIGGACGVITAGIFNSANGRNDRNDRRRP